MQFLREIQTGLWVSTFKQALTKTIKDKHKGNTGRSLYPQGASHIFPYLCISHLCYAKNMLLKKEARVIKTASGPPMFAEHSKNMCLI
jgi:hypothetical protein